MCPLRIILVFLSGILAGYLAWKSVRCEPPKEEEKLAETSLAGNKEESSFQKLSLFRKAIAAIVAGFWAFVDMASGRFLWQNLVSNANKSKNS